MLHGRVDFCDGQASFRGSVPPDWFFMLHYVAKSVQHVAFFVQHVAGRGPVWGATFSAVIVAAARARRILSSGA